MRKPDLIIDLHIVSAAAHLLLLMFSNLLFACTDNRNDSLNQLITYKRLNSKTIQVALGCDAITAISTKRGIVVIDSGISSSLAKKYREIIRKEFGLDNFLYLINTHSHPDHTGGNLAFPESVIIGHENCEGEMLEYWKEPEKVRDGLVRIVDQLNKQLNSSELNKDEQDEIKKQIIRYRSALDDINQQSGILYPDKTFSDQMTFSVDDLSFSLIYFGTAHSKSDIIIDLPELKILFTGDLFSRYGRPHFEIGKVKKSERWEIVKKWLLERKADIEQIITGHGEVLSVDDLIAFINY
ncbi:MAG: MBL fold metallo-hydrolase [Melioribacteraceae bacterium]|nr:MBL fold metallo-hydrolase [Melioribacteraceae bacterium]